MSLPFIKIPDKVILDEQSASPVFGRFTVQPLERGYGVTLGNSLRRVLLSSLTGAAFTAIRIDGVLHEFTTIPGVLEDVTDIVLILKKVRFKLLNKKAVKMEISVDGPTKLTAGDFAKFTNDIEILNPDQHIATLNSDGKLVIELRFGIGKGYVPAVEQVILDQMIGIIPIDSIYTPIVNVKYDIENVRIGEKNDFEKLVIEITTDGSITPEEALSSSAKILLDHVRLFIHFESEPEEAKVENEKDLEFERVKRILNTSVDDLELSVRSHNCLKAANIKSLADLVKRDENEMLKFRNFGRKSLAELVEIVENYNLQFGMNVEKYINEKKDNN